MLDYLLEPESPLGICPECGCEIWNRVDECPECGEWFGEGDPTDVWEDHYVSDYEIQQAENAYERWLFRNG